MAAEEMRKTTQQELHKTNLIQEVSLLCLPSLHFDLRMRSALLLFSMHTHHLQILLTEFGSEVGPIGVLTTPQVTQASSTQTSILQPLCDICLEAKLLIRERVSFPGTAALNWLRKRPHLFQFPNVSSLT